ncbi:MAG: hypothetical protein WB723_03575 [Candidatus Acidiferrales bacterium]
MKPSILYRIAAGLLLLFAVGHTLGFRQTQPQWGVDSLVAAMRSIHFDAQGFNRTYWDFYTGFGLFVSVGLLFAAVLSWQMGGLSAATLAQLRGPAWTVVLCFVVLTFLSWRYFFIAPIVFSALITLVLAAAAYSSGK